MKAVVYTRYGTTDELRLTEVPTPVPQGSQVLVKVRSVSLNLSDWEGLRGKPLYARLGGLRRPRRHVLGSDIAGQVVATGPDATLFQPGDDVFADILTYLGGFAEYVCVPQSVLARMPDGMTYEQAAALPQAGSIALQGIVERGQVRAGQRVLINGAGGGSGMYAIQLAKLHGAEVTGVDNAEKQASMRALGADHTIDYRQEDFTRNGRTYDLILDMVAYRSVRALHRSLAPGGRYFCVGGSVGTLLRVLVGGAVTGRRTGRKVRVLAVRLGVAHLAPFVELCRQGKVVTVVDRRYRLDEVPQALRYLGEGHAKGKVVVNID